MKTLKAIMFNIIWGIAVNHQQFHQPATLTQHYDTKSPTYKVNKSKQQRQRHTSFRSFFCLMHSAIPAEDWEWENQHHRDKQAFQWLLYCVTLHRWIIASPQVSLKCKFCILILLTLEAHHPLPARNSKKVLQCALTHQLFIWSRDIGWVQRLSTFLLYFLLKGRQFF